MRSLIFTFLLFVSVGKLAGQQNYIDSLKHELAINRNDTVKLIQYMLLCEAYEETRPDSGFYYAKNHFVLASELKFLLNKAMALNEMAYGFKNMGNYPASLQSYLSAKVIAEDIPVEANIPTEFYTHWDGFTKNPVTAGMMRLHVLGLSQLGLSLLYETMKDKEKALFYSLQAAQSFRQATNNRFLTAVNMILGRVYLSLNKKDSALIFEQEAYDYSINAGYKENIGSILLNLGRIQLANGNRVIAANYIRKSLITSKEQGYLRGLVAGNLLLHEVCLLEGKQDSSLYFANTALDIAQKLNSLDLLLRTYTALAAYYKAIGRNDSTVKYQGAIIQINDSLFNSKQARQFQNIEFDEQQRYAEIEAAKKAFRGRLQLYGLLTGLAVFLLLAIVLWRNNRHKQKAYVLLQNQKMETDFQKAKVDHTLEELKATQAQLIQSAKMASLGQLTAGIAHEIQNPLNFINNFSEVNAELLEELKGEADKGHFNEVKVLADDAISNEQKIIHHGRRADSIVKGMLQHSRTNTGQKESVDINAMADDYLRLAYHGIRGKNNEFNTLQDAIAIKTDFDESIGKISVVPQDIGRALLNIYDNAFYAVRPPNPSQKYRDWREEGDREFDRIYIPTVWVSTRKVADKVLISVRDNGPGISKDIIDKIFQPFFTTKPAGQGTGLGLSLAYDIVKAHGGEISVKSIAGEGSEFIIVLPG